MEKKTLYNVAKSYIDVISLIEQNKDAAVLAQLEEQRVIWHNELIDLLNREGIFYKDREHVTRMAYRIIKESE